VEIENDFVNLYHPQYQKKIMFEEIDSIDEREGNVFFSLKLKDGSVYFIGFPFDQGVGVSIAESIQGLRSLKKAKRDKDLVLGILLEKFQKSNQSSII
jgi:hypothetical protein